MKKSEAVQFLAKVISPFYDEKEFLKKEILLLNEDDWELVIALANKHQIVTNLLYALKQKELLSLISDKMLLAYLKEIYTLNKRRNENILLQTQKIVELLQKENIETVLLKGTALLAQEYYDNIALRVMLDIDILVEEKSLFKAIDILKKSGYKEIKKSELFFDWHHYNRLYHPQEMTSLELHRYPLSTHRLFPKDLKKNIHLIKSKNLESYVFTINYELIHIFLHSQISHRYHKKFFLDIRHFIDFVTLVFKYKEKIDFDFINSYMKEQNLEKEWNEYCYILQELFIVDFPFKIKKSKFYLNKSFYFLDNSNSFFVKSCKMKNALLGYLGYYNLQKRYHFKSKLFYYIYLIKHLLWGINKFLFDKEKRKIFFKGIK